MITPVAVGIQIVMFDSANNEVLVLGGMEDTADPVAADWAGIPAETAGETAFQAELLDSGHDILEERPISADTVVAKIGEPLETLIARARAKQRAAELEDEASRPRLSSNRGRHGAPER